MATTWWVGTAVANEKNYFWTTDVMSHMHHTRRTSQEQFSEALKLLMDDRSWLVSVHGNDLWIHGDGGMWLRINQDVTIEFGEPAA